MGLRFNSVVDDGNDNDNDDDSTILLTTKREARPSIGGRCWAILAKATMEDYRMQVSGKRFELWLVVSFDFLMCRRELAATRRYFYINTSIKEYCNLQSAI